MSSLCEQQGKGTQKENFRLSTLHSHAEGTGFRNHVQEGSPAESKSNQISELFTDSDSMSPSAMWLLWRTRHPVKKFYCNYIYDYWVNIQHVPVPRLHSASTSEDDDYVQSGPDPQTQQPPISQWTLPSRLQQCVIHTLIVGPRRKITLRHHTSMMALCHLAFPHCILQRLSQCLWWWLLDNITGTWTVLRWDLLPNLICGWNVCVSGNNNTNRTVLHSIPQQLDEMKHTFTHTTVSGFCRQQEWRWQDRRKLWQTMYNMGHSWNSKPDIF